MTGSRSRLINFAQFSVRISWDELDDYEGAGQFSISNTAELINRADGQNLRNWCKQEQSLPDL